MAGQPPCPRPCSILIFLITSLVHFVLKPFNQISVVSQLVVRFSLPLFLRNFNGGGDNGWNDFSVIGRYTLLGEYRFPDRGVAVIKTFTTFGIMCFLFTTGVKMDPATMFHPSHTTIVIGIVICLAMILMIAPVIVTTFHLPSDSKLSKSLPFIFSANSLAGLPVISGLLSELHLLNTELSRIPIPTAMFNDLIGMTVSAVGTTLANNIGENPMNSFFSILSVLALLLLLAYVVKPVYKQTVGHHYVLGLLFLGLIVPDSDGPPQNPSYQVRKLC
ncbi:hypothetical protein MLD38_024119 [Melastoma candidum]|uniref:Uncharacterized protein n=1 Tax=Melastoma candidum TaxID=119954 RepID=A0ACB9NRF2_9MYRT|nr:hypothetical protein MLD38_024119 [Melastoma candidum]